MKAETIDDIKGLEQLQDEITREDAAMLDRYLASVAAGFAARVEDVRRGREEREADAARLDEFNRLRTTS